jgi:hypothetical protein
VVSYQLSEKKGAKIMNSNFLFWLLTIILPITFAPDAAQQPTKVARIGWLTASLFR